MIIRPDSKRVANLYTVLTEEANKLSKMCIPFFAAMTTAIPIFIFLITQFMRNSRTLDIEELFQMIPIAAVIGAVLGFLAKGFVKNLVIKDSAALITEIKQSGLKLEGDFITGKMLKVVQVSNAATNIEPMPRKVFYVSFKTSQVSNVEVSDEINKKTNYRKCCIVTVGVEKYYLLCLNDTDAVALRDYILLNK